MLTVTKKSVWLVAGLLMASIGTASAATVEVRVPFQFVVRGQTMPAGKYLVQREGTDTLLIRGENGNRASAYVPTTPAAGHDPAGNQPSLEFRRHEQVYVLSNVWESGTVGRTVTGS